MPDATIKEIKKVIDGGFEKQAILINSAFQAHDDHFGKLIQDLKKDMAQRFDKIEDRLETVESKLDRALYTELIHLETRVKRLEQKAGIKTAQ